RTLALFVYKPESMHTKAVHHPEATRYSPVRQHPHEHVRRLRHQRGKIPEGVVRGRGLWHFVVSLWLNGMHQIREFDAVLYKENRNVVANQVVIAFFCVEFCCKAAHIAHCVSRAPGAYYSRKP